MVGPLPIYNEQVNYFTAPFLLAQPGVEVEEIGTLNEDGETWRQLSVIFPPGIPTHSARQTFYFNDKGLLQRLDYATDVAGGSEAPSLAQPSPALARTLGQLLANFGNVFVGRRPIRVACIAVEHERSRFQFRFEFFLIECNRLVVVVRTYNFGVYPVAHEPPADRAIRAALAR
ncbi:MAG: hypothetical protein JWO19_601 [Bryobacterales bacterium]|nr:hypothetical protein [Bryobacterales bacterium]